MKTPNDGIAPDYRIFLLLLSFGLLLIGSDSVHKKAEIFLLLMRLSIFNYYLLLFLVFVLELFIPLRVSSVPDECGFPPKDISWLKVFLTSFQKVMGTLDDCKLLFPFIHWKNRFLLNDKNVVPTLFFSKKKTKVFQIEFAYNLMEMHWRLEVYHSEWLPRIIIFLVIKFATSYYWNASIDMIHWLFISAEQEHIQRSESYFHFPFQRRLYHNNHQWSMVY